MIWVIFSFLSILFLILSFYYERKFTYTFRSLSITSMIISTIIMLLIMFNGITEYPWLIGKKIKVESLKSEINNVKNSYYPIKKNGSLISGSIENMKQSTNLSEYISKYAYEKSKFNENLVKIKFYKQSKIYWWVGTSIFIDNKVDSLKQID